jgi:uncharacterized membrane protein YozB (DUF420 family)
MPVNNNNRKTIKRKTTKKKKTVMLMATVDVKMTVIIFVKRSTHTKTTVKNTQCDGPCDARFHQK